MKLVLLSGGSGKRLWPLSNDARSKQFLKVMRDKQNNQISMLQRVWGQLKRTGLAKESLISTSVAQVEMIKSQIGIDVPLLTEPERRDTFPAIALAATYLFSETGCSLDEIVGVLPVDPYVDDSFFLKVKEMEEVLTLSKADIALIGVTPNYPAEKFGYIVPKNDNLNNYKDVDYFIEKPEEQKAKELIEKNALWNCGVFAFKLGYLIDILKEKNIPTDYNKLLSNYNYMPKNSFDYEIVEKANKIITLEYEGYWKDLGTWNSLTEEMSTNLLGKGVISEDVFNTNVVNELDIPITVIGVSNAIIAASPDGILVSEKDSSQRIKEYISDFDGRPMYEEYSWGWYRVLEYTKYVAGNEVLIKRIGINAGKNMSYQMHFKRSENWTITKGEGFFVIDDKLIHIRSGDIIQIPIASKHSVQAITDMEIIEVQTGTELVEADKHIIADSWDDIVNACKGESGEKISNQKNSVLNS
ncbi:sugar phosphate nucleotidyltransferase [Bacillus sp. JJ1533]|uniref:sugar phosphate nucleotidyltransferase n=1 Tax=Bacillus sp. JJ1533 TaxID=3122959 RepID=UPI002FFE9DF7